MKRSCKIILTALSLLAVPAAINHYISLKFGYLNNQYERNRHTFNWRFGSVSYKKTGRGAPVLLVHGLGIGASSYEFEAAAKVLSKYYRVYTLDLIGFGMSEKPGISYSSYLFTSLINDFVTDVIKEPCFIAASAHSADYAVMAYNLNHDNFKKMLLISPSGLKNDEPENVLLGKIVDLPLYGTFVYNILSSKLSIRYFLKKFAFYDGSMVTKSVVNKFYEAAKKDACQSRYPVSAFMCGKLNTDIRESIKRVQIPVRILWNNDAELLHSRAYKFEYSVFDRTKMLPHMEKPVSFASLCKTFFA
ncbi:MAG: alpha/beta fold hydrolase [Clostridiales bacterium]|jgi:pimeloyl-ACP methyl ester carboxylesterase|nr:alpha/beta fold hydrolase [Clostridiales bacterium]